MSFMNKTTSALVKDNARLEHEKSFRTTVVIIESVSPDQTRCRCRLASSTSRANDTIEARLILTPCFYAPINVNNYLGLLHGDSKSPIGVQLIPKSSPRPNMAHGLSTGLFGPTGSASSTPVAGLQVIPTDNIQQYINEKNYPSAQAVVIKPPTPIPPDYIGKNPIVPSTTDYLIDAATAYMSVDENEIRFIADNANAMIINTQQGISIMGQLNISTSMDSIRFGGAWTLNPAHQFCIPSTASTPQPLFAYNPPGVSITQSLQPMLTALIGLT